MTSQSVALVVYDINEGQIAAIREQCANLTCDTSAGYEEVRVAIGKIRETRTSIEKKRVELKADALEYGRFVDSEAKRWTSLLAEIEDPLKAKKAVVDDAKAREKAEVEGAKLRALQAEIESARVEQEAKERAKREAEEAKLAVERAALAAEREALAAERRAAEAARKIEQDRIDAEHARIAEAQRLEREKLDAERRAIDAERQKAERIEFERQATIRAEQEAAEKVERDRLEKARRDAELAEVLPEVEKVAVFAASIRALQAPKLKSKKLAALLMLATQSLEQIAAHLMSEAGNLKGGK